MIKREYVELFSQIQKVFERNKVEKEIVLKFPISTCKNCGKQIVLLVEWLRPEEEYIDVDEIETNWIEEQCWFHLNNGEVSCHIEYEDFYAFPIDCEKDRHPICTFTDLEIKMLRHR